MFPLECAKRGPEVNLIASFLMGVESCFTSHDPRYSPGDFLARNQTLKVEQG